ncbi:MAG: biotin/lipoyl-binding protein, partial [Geminicoccaceae bacterium]
MRPLLLVGVPLFVGLVGLYWYAVSGRYITTENAYVKSDIVTISTDIDGRVVGVEVADNQLVRQGDVLFRIDAEPFQIALAMADASILTVRHDIEASRAEFRQIEAEIEEARERVKFFQQQARRQRELEERGIAAE